MSNAKNTAHMADAGYSSRPLVLVVDDEDSICTTLTQVLQDEAFETITASNGSEALEKVLAFRPDLVFLDIWMPGWDGIVTLEKIKEASPATEVVMISGHATIANALEATKRGALDFIEKPLDIDSIMVSANRALERRRIAEEDRSKSGIEEEGRTGASVFSHPGLLSLNLKGKNLGQRTLRRSILLYGQCLHSGQKSGLVLEPLPANSGIHFARIGSSRTVPAFVDFVESTGFATTVRQGAVSAGTIEHLLSALHAYRVSNLLIKCNGEIPIFDGSALEFCKVIEDVGIEEQGGDWFELAIDRPMRIQSDERQGEAIILEPAEQFSVDYELDYPAPVGRERFEFQFSGVDSYKSMIAPARTFGFMKDIERLQKAGLAAGGRLDNFILIGPDKVLNTELRFPDELVRHKILDIIGDLFLIGRPLRAKVKARMTGHSDNVKVLSEVRKLLF